MTRAVIYRKAVTATTVSYTVEQPALGALLSLGILWTPVTGVTMVALFGKES